jgi:hypothetical protein
MLAVDFCCAELVKTVNTFTYLYEKLGVTIWSFEWLISSRSISTNIMDVSASAVSSLGTDSQLLLMANFSISNTRVTMLINKSSSEFI